MPLDTPFFIVLNAGSGKRDTETVEATIRSVLEEVGRHYDLARADHPRQLPGLARRAVELAQQQQGAVIAAGGDGTINAVAQMALNSGQPFGVLPQGTFNYFSRTHGLPTDTAKATRVLLDATVRLVQVGLINDRVFLVNASLGLYPRLLEEREAYKQQFGRSRFVALCAGVITLLRQHRQLVLSLEHEGQSEILRTPTLAVGNNPLQIEQIGIPHAHAVQQGLLVAMTVRPIGTLALLGLLCRGAMGQLGNADNVVSFAFDRLTVRPYRRRRMKVAMDGEVTWLNTPLVFRVAPHPLPLLVPARAISTSPADADEDVL
ncbi:MAG: diacylglycerol kinase family protein [Candidatus Tectomicrobia bacterium]|nr:diacylglycerol kinase family protein [Candidatus Tectomicrobia bacterium]